MRQAEVDAREYWEGEGYYRIAWSDGGPDWTSDGPIWLGSVEDLADELAAAHPSETDTHLAYAERVTVQYAVYADHMLLCEYAEHYIEKREHETASTHEVEEVFETLGKAKAFLEEVVDSWSEPYEIIHTKRGLDTIRYNSVWIEKETIDGDGYVMKSLTIECVNSLPDDVHDAAMKHQREYWEYLDYQRGSYSPLEV